MMEHCCHGLHSGRLRLQMSPVAQELKTADPIAFKMTLLLDSGLIGFVTDLSITSVKEVLPI